MISRHDDPSLFPSTSRQPPTGILIGAHRALCYDHSYTGVSHLAFPRQRLSLVAALATFNSCWRHNRESSRGTSAPPIISPPQGWRGLPLNHSSLQSKLGGPGDPVLQPFVLHTIFLINAILRLLKVSKSKLANILHSRMYIKTKSLIAYNAISSPSFDSTPLTFINFFFNPFMWTLKCRTSRRTSSTNNVLMAM